ncbi:MAG TPA: hypothetical protein PKZ32_10725 [Candidatus Melainabacteria bacterium]|nr:hypothetical protein [Candidatus Melainabacteria bacterium]
MSHEEKDAEDLDKTEDSTASCGCNDADEKKEHAKSLVERSKIECANVQSRAAERKKDRDEEIESSAVQAEKLRVKETGVLEGPNKNPTEKPCDNEEL